MAIFTNLKKKRFFVKFFCNVLGQNYPPITFWGKNDENGLVFMNLSDQVF